MNKNLVVFTLSLILLSILILWSTSQFARPSFLNAIVIALALATLLVYFLVERTAAENLVRNYLLTIVLKLIAGGVFIAALIFIDPAGSEANAITFMIAYFLFTGLEVSFLFKKFSK